MIMNLWVPYKVENLFVHLIDHHLLKNMCPMGLVFMGAASQVSVSNTKGKGENV
jgi:hypothetical protein